MSSLRTELSPTPRRVPVPSWLDLRLILGGALVLGSILLGVRVVAAADTNYPAIAMTHDAQAGTVLTASDLRIVKVRLPDRGRNVYVSAVQSVVGKQLGRAVSRDELLPSSVLGTPPALTSIAVPLAADATPPLAPGDRVTLWVSRKTCPPVTVLTDVTVQQIRSVSAGSFAASGGQVVVISVAPELADRVMTALGSDGAQLRAGLLTGSTSTAAGELPPLGCPDATPAS